MNNKKRKAIFSLFDQENAVFYAKELVALNWEIIATQETYDLLRKNKIPVTNISCFLKVKKEYPFPPTLHPSIELALTVNSEDSIDLVYVTTYPLSKGNDVGGHTILALGGKGKRIVVFNKEGMKKVIQDLKYNRNQVFSSLRQQLIDKVYCKIATHYLSLIQDPKNFEDTEIIKGEKVISLSEGENPYQVPSDFFQITDEDALAISNFKQISAISPCYTNMADFDCILQTLCLSTRAFTKYYKKAPYIVIAAKHGNPCGLAIDWNSPEIAIDKALFGHPAAIFGGETLVNFFINEKLAKKLISSNKRKSLLGSSKWSLDLIIAPGFSQEAVKMLKKRQRLGLFENKRLTASYLNKSKYSYRMVRGGFLRQPPNNYILDFTEIDSEFSLPDSDYLDSLIIAWATAWTSFHGGNEVAIAKNRMLLSAGGGPATIDSCSTVINRAKKCGHNLQDSVFAADAFFPFSDAPEKLIKAGCIYGIVPKGGKNFELIGTFFKKNNVKVFYLPEKFRGFFRH